MMADADASSGGGVGCGGSTCDDGSSGGCGGVGVGE